MKDPFLSLYEIMGEATKIEASFFIAKIISPLPNLKVNLNDLVLDKDDFLISKWLLDRHIEVFEDFTEGNHTHGDATGEGLHKHIMKEPLNNKLEVGDLVVLVPYEEKFIIISKVVELWVYFPL